MNNMNYSFNKSVQILFLFFLLFILYYWSAPNINSLFQININIRQIMKNNSNDTSAISNKSIVTIIATSISATKDPAELVIERSPSSPHYSNGTLAVFTFHTRHTVLADLQLFLIKKLARNLIAIELFLDGPASKEMQRIAHIHKAGLHTFTLDMHRNKTGPSTRNANVVNWALATQGKAYLRNGTAILLLDGDVFPLTPFDSVTLLNAHDLVCRKHPATFARFCWIGLICLAPQLYSTIDDFNVSPIWRKGQFNDAGGRTLDYLMKYSNTTYSWMKETILLENDPELFWGAIDPDITWVKSHFKRCDKCGPEIFFSPFKTSNAVFYHMISGTSEWRFPNQVSRRKRLSDSIMQSPYNSDRTDELTASIKKIQKMELIPFYGNLTCARICRGKN